MNFGLVLVGIALLAFPGVRASRSRGCPPHEWTRVSAWAVMIGAACVFGGLMMTALPPVLHTLHLEGLIAVCDPAVHSLMLGGPLVGWTAVALTLVIASIAAAAIRTSHRAVRRARIEPWLGRHLRGPDYELVVLPTSELLAFGVPGRAPQIVISEGMVNELEPTRLDAVIGHELAHHRLRHSRYMVATAVIERTLGVLPVVRRSTEAIRASLEVWADDFAVASQSVTREALHEALVAVTTAQSSAIELAVRTRTERLIDAVRCSPVATRGLTYLPAGALACCAAVLTAWWALSSSQMLAVGSYC
jgi:Zn-dependent protease with chaperone function